MTPLSRRNFVSLLASPAVLRFQSSQPAGHGAHWSDTLGRAPGENWLTYHGDYSGKRFSRLAQLDRTNVKRLAARWVYQSEGTRRQQCTPIVQDGVMYVTASNHVYALDARTGKQLWHYRIQLPQGMNADGNRGVAILDQHLFVTTTDARLLSLDARNGGIIWETKVADPEKEHRLTQAPLVVKDRVICGIGYGDWGMRGFLDAYDARTGKQVWRFWTVPKPGERFSETWPANSNAWETGGGATWMTGTYDPESNLIYWGTGNPGPDFYGGGRAGDNLLTNCVIALEAGTGKLKWHFQFTPHDTHDWDAAEVPMLIDATWKGSPRKLLVEANRNAYFYVLDRLTGEYLLGKQFVHQTWSRGLDSKGRPEVIPGTDPTPQGVEVCPTIVGATNWMSPSYNSSFGLYYVVCQEGCEIYTSSEAPFQQGKHNYMGTGTASVPNKPARMVFRALDIRTGEKRWEYPMPGAEVSWGGTLATAGNLVFVGDAAGNLVARDAESGVALWHFYTGNELAASPMTYSVSGKQYVAIASGGAIFAFSLPD